MINKNIILYGETANQVRFLKDETDLFERFLDVFIVGASLGMLYDLKGMNKSSDNKITIFVEQIQKESSQIKFLSSMSFFLDKEKVDEEDSTNLLEEAFGDWYRNQESNEKYKIFEKYAIGGINFLYEKITDDATNKTEYLNNYYRLIKEINEDKIDDSKDRAIIKGMRT